MSWNMASPHRYRGARRSIRAFLIPILDNEEARGKRGRGERKQGNIELIQICLQDPSKRGGHREVKVRNGKEEAREASAVGKKRDDDKNNEQRRAGASICRGHLIILSFCVPRFLVSWWRTLALFLCHGGLIVHSISVHSLFLDSAFCYSRCSLCMPTFRALVFLSI